MVMADIIFINTRTHPCYRGSVTELKYITMRIGITVVM